MSNTFVKKHKNLNYTFSNKDIIRIGSLVYVFNEKRTFSLQFPYSPAQVRGVNHSDKKLRIRKDINDPDKDEVVNYIDSFKLVSIDFVDTYEKPEWLTIDMVLFLRSELYIKNKTLVNNSEINYDELFRELNLRFTNQTININRQDIIKVLKDLF